jgi:hypothetical protein
MHFETFRRREDQNAQRRIFSERRIWTYLKQKDAFSFTIGNFAVCSYRFPGKNQFIALPSAAGSNRCVSSRKRISIQSTFAKSRHGQFKSQSPILKELTYGTYGVYSSTTI